MDDLGSLPGMDPGGVGDDGYVRKYGKVHVGDDYQMGSYEFPEAQSVETVIAGDVAEYGKDGMSECVWRPRPDLLSWDALDEYLDGAKGAGCEEERALQTLMVHGYDSEAALKELLAADPELVPPGECWSTRERAVFEQLFAIHGKAFDAIAARLPGKITRDVVNYFYNIRQTVYDPRDSDFESDVDQDDEDDFHYAPVHESSESIDADVESILAGGRGRLFLSASRLFHPNPPPRPTSLNASQITRTHASPSPSPPPPAPLVLGSQASRPRKRKRGVSGPSRPSPSSDSPGPYSSYSMSPLPSSPPTSNNPLAWNQPPTSTTSSTTTTSSSSSKRQRTLLGAPSTVRPAEEMGRHPEKDELFCPFPSSLPLPGPPSSQSLLDAMGMKDITTSSSISTPVSSSLPPPSFPRASNPGSLYDDDEESCAIM